MECLAPQAHWRWERHRGHLPDENPAEQVDFIAVSGSKRRLKVGRRTDDLIAEVLYNTLHHGSYDRIVLDDEDTGTGIKRHFGLITSRG